jgi:hypothetical protein
MAETLDLAALEEAARLLDTARNADRWFEYTNSCTRLSTWLTEHAPELLRLARLGLEHERLAAALATREAEVDRLRTALRLIGAHAEIAVGLAAEEGDADAS